MGLGVGGAGVLYRLLEMGGTWQEQGSCLVPGDVEGVGLAGSGVLYRLLEIWEEQDQGFCAGSWRYGGPKQQSCADAWRCGGSRLLGAVSPQIMNFL